MEQGQAVRTAGELSNQEIVTEVRELHGQFKDLAELYSNATPAQRPEIREQMEPLVAREHELRQEYTGRGAQELAVQDRVPEVQIEYGR